MKNKKQMKKFLAKFVWYTVTAITTIAVITLLVSVAAMIENFAYSIIPIICLVWLGIYSMFISWASK